MRCWLRPRVLLSLPCDSLWTGIGKGNGFAALRRVTAGAFSFSGLAWVVLGLLVAINDGCALFHTTQFGLEAIYLLLLANHNPMRPQRSRGHPAERGNASMVLFAPHRASRRANAPADSRRR